MHVLITGAAGKTGKAIIRSLSGNKLRISALVHKRESAKDLESMGVDDIVIGDLLDSSLMLNTLRGVDVLYLIVSNMNPQEKEICSGIVDLCRTVNVNRIIYHSVLHPQVSSMPHHWQKMQVEELLFASSLDFTILQPTAYMQNILGYRNAIDSGIYPMPYSIHSNISLVDLQDVSEIAAKVIIESGHSKATYELVGTPLLSQTDVAEALSHHLNKDVVAIETPIYEWENSVSTGNMGNYTKNALKSMFKYYSSYGLSGNDQVLTWLLKRKPTTLEQFLKRDYIIT